MKVKALKEPIIKQVTVKEWYEKRKDGVYRIWEFANGSRIETKSPFNEVPYISVDAFSESE